MKVKTRVTVVFEDVYDDVEVFSPQEAALYDCIQMLGHRSNEFTALIKSLKVDTYPERDK